MRVAPELVTKVKYLVKTYLFGLIPWVYENEVKEKILFDRVLNRAVNGNTEKLPDSSFNSSNIYIPLSADFTER